MAQDDSGDIEYSIVVYYDPAAKSEQESELFDKTTDMDAAFQKAEELIEDKQYYKVEIKKKYQEPKTGRELDMVLKVFEKGKRLRFELGIIGSLVLTIVCTVLAFSAAYFFGQMMNGTNPD